MSDSPYSQNQAHWPPGFILHTIPMDDHDKDGKLCLHYASKECWCQPLQVEPHLWAHHALDTREARERMGHDTGLFWATIGELPRS